jgi:hypothetical protein
VLGGATAGPRREPEWRDQLTTRLGRFASGTNAGQESAAISAVLGISHVIDLTFGNRPEGSIISVAEWRT